MLYVAGVKNLTHIHTQTINIIILVAILTQMESIYYIYIYIFFLNKNNYTAHHCIHDASYIFQQLHGSYNTLLVV